MDFTELCTPAFDSILDAQLLTESEKSIIYLFFGRAMIGAYATTESNEFLSIEGIKGAGKTLFVQQLLCGEVLAMNPNICYIDSQSDQMDGYGCSVLIIDQMESLSETMRLRLGSYLNGTEKSPQLILVGEKIDQEFKENENAKKIQFDHVFDFQQETLLADLERESGDWAEKCYRSYLHSVDGSF